MTGLARVLAAGLVAALLAACGGPVYRTDYTYTPPASAEGQTCTAAAAARADDCRDRASACRREVRFAVWDCENAADMDDALCKGGARDRSDYNRCLFQERRDDRVCRDLAWRLQRLCGTDAECDATYREDYRACGGAITERTVCVDNCDQATGTPAN